MKQLIYFTAGWCPSYQNMKPTISQLKKTGIQIAEIDVDYDTQYVQQYGIKNIPALVLLENGNEVRRSIGYRDMNQVNTFING